MVEISRAVEELTQYIEREEPRPHYWYSGVTHDVETTLRTVHRVDPGIARWTSVQVGDPLTAEAIESRLIDEVGTDGSGAPPPPGARTVYIFLKDASTSP